MRYVDCTYLEIASHANNGWLALIPMGCTEQQGPHLGVGFDTWFAEELLLTASQQAAADHQIGCLVLPPLPFGPTPEHRGFRSGYVDLPVAVHDAVCDAILASLAEQGFSRLVVWRGCGGHDLRARIDHFNQRWRGQARAFLPDPPLHQIWCQVADSAVAGGHADGFTTSIALHPAPGVGPGGPGSRALAPDSRLGRPGSRLHRLLQQRCDRRSAPRKRRTRRRPVVGVCRMDCRADPPGRGYRALIRHGPVSSSARPVELWSVGTRPAGRSDR